MACEYFQAYSGKYIFLSIKYLKFVMRLDYQIYDSDNIHQLKIVTIELTIFNLPIFVNQY